MSTWTKIQKLSGIRKSLVQKEDIIDKQIGLNEFSFSLATLLMNINRIGWQNKLENYML